MATTEKIQVRVTDAQGQGPGPPAEMTLKVWTKMDARGRALKWGAAVIGVAILILPIPVVHFGAIPIVLLGAPLVTFVVYRVYSNGTDLEGVIKCPSCGAEANLNTDGDRWPLHRVCNDCRASYQLDRC